MNRDVNPENLEEGDIISTSRGIARVYWVNEIEGTIGYMYLSEPYAGFCPSEDNKSIRSVHLLSKKKDPRQLEFPFIQEMVEAAIMERNKRLEEMRGDVFMERKKTSKKAKTADDASLLKLLNKLTPEQRKQIFGDDNDNG